MPDPPAQGARIASGAKDVVAACPQRRTGQSQAMTFDEAYDGDGTMRPAYADWLAEVLAIPRRADALRPRA